MLATSTNDEAMQELWNECAKREDWLAFGDEWDAVDKPFRLKWRPTPYNVFAVFHHRHHCHHHHHHHHSIVSNTL
jgi:hypothetical protein